MFPISNYHFRQIIICPKSDREEYEEYLGLFCSFDYKLPIEAHCEFWLVDKHRNEKEKDISSHLFYPGKEKAGYGYADYVERSKLFDTANGFIDDNGILTVAGKVRIIIFELIHKICLTKYWDLISPSDSFGLNEFQLKI